MRKKEMQGEFREKVKLTKAQYEQEKMDKKGEYAKKL